jgi:5'-nucleotidase
MNRPVILVDQDGVIADYTTHLYTLWREYYPEEYERYHIPITNLTLFKISHHYRGNARQHLEELRDRDGFYEHIPLLSGAREALGTLLEEYEVFICTRPTDATQAQCAKEKTNWVKRELGDEWAERLIIARDKTAVFGDILIDDNPSVVGNISPHWTHVLYDRPYNKAVAKPRLSWDTNWREVIVQALCR